MKFIHIEMDGISSCWVHRAPRASRKNVKQRISSNEKWKEKKTHRTKQTKKNQNPMKKRIFEKLIEIVSLSENETKSEFNWLADRARIRKIFYLLTIK